MTAVVQTIADLAAFLAKLARDGGKRPKENGDERGK
jgi:hypothetical protein